jgi:hypothetical protein
MATKAWAAQAKACAAKAMPWLPRLVTAKACHGCQGMLCQDNATAAKACHGCQGMPSPRHVIPRQCHGCQGMSRPRHVLLRKCHGLPRLATAKACAAKAMPWAAKAMPLSAKACHGQGMCCHGCQGMPRPRHVLPRHGLPTTRTKSITLSVQRLSLRVLTGIIVKILFVWEG